MRSKPILLTAALLLTALVPAACETPGRRERRKDGGASLRDANAGGGTVAYSADDAAPGPGAAPASDSSAAPAEPAAGAGSAAVAKPATPGVPAEKGARIDAMILTTRSVPPQYAVAITADVPTSGYDFGIDESRFDGSVLTIYLDLREPKRGVPVEPVPTKLTARFESGKRVVSKARVFVNVIRSDAGESGFQLLKTVE